jgi:murein DD-endopeptidase MepM/ murein hydrolase activator NlpD
VHTRANAAAMVKTQLAADQSRYAELQQESDKVASLLVAAQAAAARAAATTTPSTLRPGPSGLLWPTSGPVTSPFGYRIDPVTHERALHAGVDIGAPEGQPIMAAQSGVVAFAGQEQGYGNYTCIDHGGGFATCYAHQSAILVTVGEAVTRGQRIGLVGDTGYATGPHLHFETRVNGVPVNPMQYF